MWYVLYHVGRIFDWVELFFFQYKNNTSNIGVICFVHIFQLALFFDQIFYWLVQLLLSNVMVNLSKQHINHFLLLIFTDIMVSPFLFLYLYHLCSLSFFFGKKSCVLSFCVYYILLNLLSLSLLTFVQFFSLSQHSIFCGSFCHILEILVCITCQQFLFLAAWCCSLYLWSKTCEN